MSKLAGEIVGKHVGPILVCGGAPNLPQDLGYLRENGFDFENATIVSGNEHAIYAGLTPHYIAVNDDVHTVLKQYQEPRMRKLAPTAQLLSRHWWGDYRGPRMVKANSGLTAVLWAGLMGGSPVVLAGFELYRGTQSYFHKEWAAPSPSMARPDEFMSRQLVELKKLLGGTPVRVVSGPLIAHWPIWNAKEQFQPRGPTELERKLRNEAAKGRLLCAEEDTAWDGALLPAGAVFAVTQAEAQSAALNQGFVDVTDKPVDLALEESREQARLRHARTLVVIAKARNHPRTVRRGIYDADLAKIVRWTDEGQPPQLIGPRMGLPWQQVQTLVEMMGLDTIPPPALRSQPSL